jgi:hypothetical protein
MGELKQAQKRRSTMCLVPKPAVRPPPEEAQQASPLAGAGERPRPPPPPKPTGLTNGPAAGLPPPPPVNKPATPPKPPSLAPKPAAPPKPEHLSDGGDEGADPKPSWRELIRQRRNSQAKLNVNEEEAERRTEEERWAGVPEWKRKVLQAKVGGGTTAQARQNSERDDVCCHCHALSLIVLT